MGEIGFMTGWNVNHVIACETNLLGAIEKHYGAEEKVWDFLKNMPGFENVEFKKEASEEEVSFQSFDMNSETPAIIKLVTMTIVDAAKSRASNIHIEPRERYVWE
jgi:type IV pilus assembly protein PilB